MESAKKQKSASEFSDMTESELGANSSSHLSSTDFCRLVWKRFKKRPEVYQKFLRILGKLQSSSFDHVEIVKQLIVLFEGQKDLIRKINSFLPEEIYIDVQKDAVVIKVFKKSEKADAGQKSFTHSELNQQSNNDSVNYIARVKEHFISSPDIYKSFISTLKDFHMKKINEFDTIYMVISLFKSDPDLVLGFNEFLPSGYKIRMYNKSSYVVESKDEDGNDRKTRMSVKCK